MNSDHDNGGQLSRRTFIQAAGAATVLAGLDSLKPAYARSPLNAGNVGSVTASSEAGAEVIDLLIHETSLPIRGRNAVAMTINGTVPGPLVRLREHSNAIIRVTNGLMEDTSIHWHGLLVPNIMDGVPGVTFPGIAPGRTYSYEFPVRQNGTYWYHSHSGLQEQTGVYGPIIIDSAMPEPFSYDREYVVMLSDWTFENPYRVIDKLKKKSDYYNYQKRTLGDFFHDVKRVGLGAAVSDRLAWGRMRMSPVDISDVTGATYTYLMNGRAPEDNWTGLFRPGERVRLRFVNAGGGSYFDVRIPGLPMEVVQVSGQDIQPVDTDEFRIAIAETYDVIVHPKEDRAYTIFAESMDRSGYARGTLATGAGMSAPIPERRARPLLTMSDMGMDMAGMAGMDMSASGGKADMPGMDMSSHPQAGQAAGAVSPAVPHPLGHHGPANAAVPMMTRSRLAEPGPGLGSDGWRVLVYTDLKRLMPNPDFREPDREIELHLTGNMERYMWSIDGLKYSEAPAPIRLHYGERVRLTLVNDTMMAHPMHLHGMFMELENGHGARCPLIHTINVKPSERASLLVTANEPGLWAFHCHILFHMEMGMFRVVEVEQPVATQ